MRVALLLPIALFACTTKSAPPSSHDDLRPEATLDGKLPLHMRNCPSAVPSAHTVTTPTKHGVDVTITSPDAEARATIVRLAALQAAEGNPLWMMPRHTGLHGGRGTMGRCPVIHANTNVTYRRLPDGVRIHVVARSAADIAQLQQATEARARALALPSS